MIWPQLFLTPLGAFFGTTFAPLLFQTYREIAPAPFSPPLSLTYNNTPKATDSPRSSVGSPPDALPQQHQADFVNPNPHGGKKRPAGGVYEAKLFGFRVNEKARSGPRMRWLRMRPESLEELDSVDWQGQWKSGLDGDEEFDDDDADGDDEEDDGTGGHLENFDDDFPGEEDQEEEEEEEEDGAAGPSGRAGRSSLPSIPHPPAAPSGRLGRGKARADDSIPHQESEAESEASTRKAAPISKAFISDSDLSTSEVSTPNDDDDLPSPPPTLGPRGNLKPLPATFAALSIVTPLNDESPVPLSVSV